ncbi:MAG: DUF3105 domain-containing protein [Actinomycetota bacterium]|nr:DUF3105 domain-containing protein [Actinomycetota bacterium]
MGKSRADEGRRPTGSSGGGLSRSTILIGLIVLVFIAGFIALVVIDSGQRAGTAPPEGVEEFNVGKAGQHTQANVDYEQDPPVAGEHNPIWQNSAFYEEPIRNENAVHTLEHGAVWITYSPDLPQDQQEALREIVEGQDCLLASPYPGLPAGTPLVASAWGAQVQLTGVDDPNLQRFIRSYRKGPQTPEPGATCTGGISDTA